ncbi:MAG: AMP-binding protein [Propionibacteriaceae bacterium]|nr:AMP-binding protein [Propionibacteriaceae bacterium]
MSNKPTGLVMDTLNKDLEKMLTDGTGWVSLVGDPIDGTVVPPDFSGALVPTTGSTGFHKIVLLSREALMASASMTHEYVHGPGAWASCLSPHCVAGAMTTIRAIVAGQPHYQVSPDLHDLTPARGRAFLSMVPPQLHLALADENLRGALATYEAVLVGGGPLNEAQRRDAEHQGIRVVSTYGMTETCGGVVYDGVALPGVVISFAGITTPEDVDANHGQIIVDTPTAFSGYLGQSGVAHHSSTRVRTQDSGRLVNGRLEILGRIDDVVVCGGRNVNLTEIQQHLEKFFPHQTACFAVPNPTWGSTIIVASQGPTLDLISGKLATVMESAAKPRGFLDVETLPRTPSGKIDRVALFEEWRQRGKHSSLD